MLIVFPNNPTTNGYAMRFRLFIFLALLSLTGALKADTITGSVTGVIAGSNTIDTFGILGLAGANLNGNSVLLKYSYNTADFLPNTGPCGIGCLFTYESVLSPRENVSVTVNGQTQTYSPSSSSLVLFQNAIGSNAANNVFSESIDFGDGFGTKAISSRGVSLAFSSATPVAFGQPVTPGGVGRYNITFYDVKLGYEYLDFTPSPATPSPAPEPSSIILVGTGLLGMAGVMKRRFFCDETRRSLH